MAITIYGQEKARVAAFNAIVRRVEIQTETGLTLASADVPPDAVDPVPDGAAANKAPLTLIPAASGVAAFFRIYDAPGSGGQLTAEATASDVMDTTTVQAGSAVLMPPGALKLGA